MPRPYRALPAAARIPVRRRPSQEPLRQGPEDRAAGTARPDLGQFPAVRESSMLARMDFFPGFRRETIDVGGGVGIHAVVGPSRPGPAVLLLHGYPQTHVIWHRIAGRLAARFNVVAADLRGYGDSAKPMTSADHAPY